MVLISIPAFMYADRWGRRTSAIAGGIALSLCMLIIGSLYATGSVHADSGIGRWVVVVLIFLFALSYSATWAVVGKIYASEIQPAQTRTAANSLAQGLNFVRSIIHPIIRLHGHTLMNTTVYKLACRLHYSNIPRPLSVRSVLCLWGFLCAVSCRPCYQHA